MIIPSAFLFAVIASRFGIAIPAAPDGMRLCSRACPWLHADLHSLADEAVEPRLFRLQADCNSEILCRNITSAGAQILVARTSRYQLLP